jgi:hypothetical protein
VLYSIISDVDNYIIIIQFSKPCYKGFSKTASYDILIQYCPPETFILYREIALTMEANVTLRAYLTAKVVSIA